MYSEQRRTFGLAAVAALTLASAVAAQDLPTRGFDIRLAPGPTGEELSAQPNFWALDVAMKPMRMIVVNLTDPSTGQARRERIWYLVYRVNARPMERRQREQNLQPLNVEDPMPEPIFAPDFTLVTNDGGRQQIYDDVIVPEAQQAIQRRERMTLKNAVQIMGPLPRANAEAAESGEGTLYGVAMWRGVDPSSDYFTLFGTGFSNGYRLVSGPEGEPLAERRTMLQEYWRPGDEINPNEREFRPQGDPSWIYRVAEPVPIPLDVEAAMAPLPNAP